MADIQCPACSATIGEHLTEYGDMACENCGLAGSAHVLDVLTFNLGLVKTLRAEVERLKSPAVVLAESERLLRESSGGYCKVDIRSHAVHIIDAWLHDNVAAKSLAEAYAALAATNHPGFPDSSGGRDG